MMYDLIIIGAGPGGLTACLYALRSRLNVLLIDKALPGGYLAQILELENYPGFEVISGFELAEQMVKQLEKYNYQFKQLDVEKIEKNNRSWDVISGQQRVTAKALIIATGSSPRKLGVEGEQEFIGKGVSYCGVCDAPFFRNKEVVVIGGGNTALEEAIYLTKFANKVTIVHRRQGLRAEKILEDRARENEKIKFILNAVCTKISGAKTVEQINIEDVNTGNQEIIKTQGVFIFVGMDPQTKFLNGLLETDKAGNIISDKNLAASEQGVFVCGDCTDIALRQVITACGQGAIAAHSVNKYLES
ncbi:MAG: thioredoxin-disulfide reductase [Candidatus Omnitrophica bacterium]|nr:thioredoxin-disulfide reductase [Candidatus Omnitrophota bacterium]